MLEGYLQTYMYEVNSFFDETKVIHLCYYLLQRLDYVITSQQNSTKVWILVDVVIA